jgi:hypothetical protein
MVEGRKTTIEQKIVQLPLFTIEHFDRKISKWSRWVERFELTRDLSGIAEDKKKSLLLHWMGQEAYNVLCDKLSPTKPINSTYKNIVDTLEKYFDPKPIEVVENFKFHKRYQLENESVDEFIVTLRKMASTCNFGDYLDTALRNQFVFGLKNAGAQKDVLRRKN